MAVFPVVDGVVQATTDTPADAFYRGGIGYTSAGLMHITDVISSNYANGLPLSDSGQVVFVDATSGLPAGVSWVNGIPVSADGAVCMSSNAVSYYSNGLPFDANGAIVATVFAPSSLFAASEPGVWYDPSDFSTMFQDSAGTTPVTAVEQPVGLILDKSGNDFHAYQTTSTSRPVLKQDGNGKYYLKFDGVDDWLVTPTITPGTDKAQVFAGVRNFAAAVEVITELSVNTNSNNGSFVFYRISNGVGFASRGTIAVDINSLSGYLPPTTNIFTCLGDISGDSAILRANAVQILSSTADQGTGNYLAYPLYIGRRGGTTLPFNGHLYSLIVRFGANLPAGTIASTESWVNGKTGAY